MLCARHLFIPKLLSPQFLSVFTFPGCRNLSSSKEKEALLDVQEEDEKEILAREAEIEKMRNKSGLRHNDFNKQHDKPPYDAPITSYHNSLRFRRRLYGKYGESSKVNPAILWPSKVELAEIKEYVGVAQPFTIQELIKRNEERKEMEEEKRKMMKAQILEQVRRVPIEIMEFKKKVEQKRLKAEALIEKHNRLIIETKKCFDYPIDIRDEKFQLKMAELKEKERKNMAAEKKSRKIEKMKKLKEKYQDSDKSEEVE